MSLESALRTQLLTNSSLVTIIGSRIYVGDVPYAFTYPFIRIGDGGEFPENPDDSKLKNRLVRYLKIDIFAQHSPSLGYYGAGDVDSIANSIRDQFDAVIPTRWMDSSSAYDVQTVEYKGGQTKKNTDVTNIQKTIILTIIYNVIQNLPI